MKEEWKNELRIDPEDNLNYHISEEVINYTTRILREYGTKKPASEGLVYWGGIKNNSDIIISTCIVPKIKATRYNLKVDHHANFKVVESLNSNKVIHLGQVHTHPFDWVGHSITDDEGAAFKVKGLLSIVVPYFAKYGMLPINICGIHRYDTGQFHRLSDEYITRQFHTVSNISPILIDLRK
jgi:hypothetical protein